MGRGGPGRPELPPAPALGLGLESEAALSLVAVEGGLYLHLRRDFDALAKLMHDIMQVLPPRLRLPHDETA